MKRCLRNILFFLFPLTMGYLILIFSVNGYTDTSYFKFTSPKQKSLIIGPSRALQGLVPLEINKVLKRDDIFNFAFNLGNAPYGKVYLNAIKEKTDTSSKNGIFILTIDPWAVSSISKDPDDESSFRENGLKLDQMHFFTLNPNIEYIFKYIKPKTMIHGMLKEFNLVNYTSFLHKDGWLELFIPMNEKIVEQRALYKFNDYKKKLNHYKFSKKRLFYLEETIQYLQNYGNVFIVRLPVHKEMLKIENILMSNFDSIAGELSKNFNTPYINFAKDSTKYIYTDGNHLYKESGKIVSEKLAKLIREKLTE